MSLDRRSASFTSGLFRVTAVLTLATALTALAGDKARREREPRAEPPSSRSSFEKERDAAIDRAHDEIRRNPRQKKFILFRYGLEEKDLR